MLHYVLDGQLYFENYYLGGTSCSDLRLFIYFIISIGPALNEPWSVQFAPSMSGQA